MVEGIHNHWDGGHDTKSVRFSWGTPPQRNTSGTAIARPYVVLTQDDGGDTKRTTGTASIETAVFVFTAYEDGATATDALAETIIDRFDRAQTKGMVIGAATPMSFDRTEPPILLEMADENNEFTGIWAATIKYKVTVNMSL